MLIGACNLYWWCARSTVHVRLFFSPFYFPLFPRQAIIIAGGRVNAGAPAQPGLWVYDTEADPGHGGWVFEETPFGGSSQVAGIIVRQLHLSSFDHFWGNFQHDSGPFLIAGQVKPIRTTVEQP